MAEVEIWRSDVAKSSPEPLPSSSVPSDSAATEVSFPEYGSSTSRLMSLAEALSKEEILNGLQIPLSVDPLDATNMALAYATQAYDIVRAETLIAERRYRQMLISAKCLKLHLIKARGKYQRASRNLDHFRDISSKMINSIHREDRHEGTSQNGISSTRPLQTVSLQVPLNTGISDGRAAGSVNPMAVSSRAPCAVSDV